MHLKSEGEPKIFLMLVILIILFGYLLLQERGETLAGAFAKTIPQKTLPEKEEPVIKETVTETTPEVTSKEEPPAEKATETVSQKTIPAQDVPEEETIPEEAAETIAKETGETEGKETGETVLLNITAEEKPSAEEIIPFAGRAVEEPKEEVILVQELLLAPEEKENETLLAGAKPLLPVEIITLEMENVGAETIVVKSKIEEKVEIELENEEGVIKRIQEKIINERIINERKPEASIQQDAQQSIEDIKEKLMAVKLIEREAVKPVFVRKVFRPFDYVAGGVSGITYTKARTSANLLRSVILSGKETSINAGETEEVRVEVRKGLSSADRAAEIIFTSAGEELFRKKIIIEKNAAGAAIDLNTEKKVFDLYLSFPESGRYFFEISIKKKEKALYYELFGPYSVGQNVILSQEFRYCPEIYSGLHQVAVKVYKDRKLIAQNEFELGFG